MPITFFWNAARGRAEGRAPLSKNFPSNAAPACVQGLEVTTYFTRGARAVQARKIDASKSAKLAARWQHDRRDRRDPDIWISAMCRDFLLWS